MPSAIGEHDVVDAVIPTTALSQSDGLWPAGSKVLAIYLPGTTLQCIYDSCLQPTGFLGEQLSASGADFHRSSTDIL